MKDGTATEDDFANLLFTRNQDILLDANRIDSGLQKDVISLASLMPYNVDYYTISDAINQLMNGWVDVAKKGWVFDIQATKEVSPTLLMMIQSGVPVDQATYFVANRLTRMYVEKQKFAKSLVYDAVNKKVIPVNKRNYRNQALYDLVMHPDRDWETFVSLHTS